MKQNGQSEIWNAKYQVEKEKNSKVFFSLLLTIFRSLQKYRNSILVQVKSRRISMIFVGSLRLPAVSN